MLQEKPDRVIKVLFSGHPNGLQSFPSFLKDYSDYATDFCNPDNYQAHMFNLLGKLYESDEKMLSFLLVTKKP